MCHAAGILLVRSDGAILLAKRSFAVSDPGYWSIPGGGRKYGELPIDAALREFAEEMGSVPRIEPFHERLTRSPHGYFTTIIATISVRDATRWQPTLNWEHTDWGWFFPDALPKPLHPGVELLV